MNRQELENRLIDFAVSIITIADNLPSSRSGATIANQIVRSGTSPALNYGEAQSAESAKDFVHKCQVVLKELRETNISLQIIKRARLLTEIDGTIGESNELIRIFVATVSKLKKNGK